MPHTNTVRVLQLSLVAALVGLAGTAWAAQPDIAPASDLARRRASKASHGEAPAASRAVFEVQTYYRSSVTRGIEAEKTLTLSGDNQQEVATYSDLEVTASYSDSPYEGRSLVVNVHRTDSGQTVVQQLYQMSRERAPANQFHGEHGFSGLVYVYHPVSGAEVQLIVKTR